MTPITCAHIPLYKDQENYEVMATQDAKNCIPDFHLVHECGVLSTCRRYVDRQTGILGITEVT
jgi:hypothetical protein